MAEPAGVPAPAFEPPEGYYLDNFTRMLDHVAGVYADLLTPGESAFVARFRALPLGARRLYIRLHSRKGPLFRRDRLAYAEIPELDDAVAALLEAGLLDRAADAEPAALLALLVREELGALAREQNLGAPRAALRGELEALLLADSTTWPARLAERVGVLRPRGLEQIALIQLLFFGNLYQDWTEFLLSDLGVVRYESYELRHELRLFDSRAAIDHTLHLRAERGEVARALAAGLFDDALARAREVAGAIESWHPSSRRHADAILVEVGRAAERRGLGDVALELYRGAHEPPARERRARLLAAAGDFEGARALCAEMASSARDETEKVFASEFGSRIESPRLRRRRAFEPEIRELRLPRRAGVAVEHQALQALGESGQRGLYGENWLWKSLFGLAFWDIVFQPLPGAFCHPFQFGPLDLSTSAFRPARAAAIDARLAELRAADDLRPPLLEVYDRKLGLANALVSWHPQSRGQLDFALGLVRGPQLATLCDRLAHDLGRYRRGLPDLLLQSGESFELWEVKAPGDQLRPEQIAWLAYLQAHGIRAGVLRLLWLPPGG